MLAGRLPSVLVFGTVNCRSTMSPRRDAVRSGGATGILSSGGSGGPFLPHETTTSNAPIAQSADAAENSFRCARGNRRLAARDRETREKHQGGGFGELRVLCVD